MAVVARRLAIAIVVATAVGCGQPAATAPDSGRGTGGNAAPDARTGGGAATGGNGGAAPDAARDPHDIEPPSDRGASQEDVGRPGPPAFDWVGVIGTGQSLAVGNLGVPVTTVNSPYRNLKLSLGAGVTGPPFDPNAASLSVVPLSEPIRPLVPLTAFPSAYPANIFGETPHTFMANQISALYAATGQGEYQTIHSVIGESGQNLAVISKGAQDTGRTGRAYAVTMFEVTAIKRLAIAAGKTYGVGAIILTHGESDPTSDVYEDGVHKLWADYNADLRATTGQATSIPMLLTQQHSAPFGAGSSSTSTLAAWRLGVKYPGDIICVGPKYQYQYASDGRHLTTHEYDRLGAKYGQVYYQRVVLGRDWQPLQPLSAVKRGRTITVTFNVPVGPLNWDETITPPHQTAMTEWSKARGFEVKNASGRAAIDAVMIEGSAVVIMLAADSQASGWSVGYAMAQDDAGAMAGPTRGRRGQLRDADPLVGVDAEVIACAVSNGSTQIQARMPGAFRDHGERDVAEGTGLPADTIVAARTSDSVMRLSQPWTGPSGMADIKLRSDHRNYCVSFEMPVETP